MIFVIKNFKVFLLLFLIIIGILVLIQIGISNSQSSNGQMYYDLIILEEQLYIQNEILKTEIALKSSLSNIEKLAKDRGFVKNTNLQFITTY